MCGSLRVNRSGVKHKRVGHAALEVTLLMNDYEIQADVAQCSGIQ